MNWAIIEGSWTQLKIKVKLRWKKLATDRMKVIAIKRAGSEGNLDNAATRTESVMQEEIQSRRAVLRGALAVGCGLLAPVLFGSIASSANAAAATAAVKKVSKASVQYQSHAKGAEKCNQCVNFISESSTCTRVEGKINPNGHCILWAKKT